MFCAIVTLLSPPPTVISRNTGHLRSALSVLPSTLYPLLSPLQASASHASARVSSLSILPVLVGFPGSRPRGGFTGACPWGWTGSRTGQGDKLDHRRPLTAPRAAPGLRWPLESSWLSEGVGPFYACIYLSLDLGWPWGRARPRAVISCAVQTSTAAGSHRWGGMQL